MKKILFFIALPLLLVSCKGIEQYQTSIDELASNWDSTTTTVTEFSQMVSTDLTQQTQKLAGLDDMLASATLSPEQTQTLEGAKKAALEALGGYPALQQNINEFVTTWTEKSAAVTALKDGLAAGKIEGDIPAQISELSGLVTTAAENLTTWKGTFETVKSGADQAVGSLTQMVADFAASK